MKGMHNKVDFRNTKEYIKNNRKIDGHKFNKVTDITNMIDFLNQEAQKESEDRAANETLEISKFLARIMTQKTILIGKK